MKLTKLTQLAAISASLLGSTTFAASNDALLDLLVKKGVLTQNEATAVAAELKEEAPVYVTAKGKAVTDIKLLGVSSFNMMHFPMTKTVDLRKTDSTSAAFVWVLKRSFSTITTQS